MTKTGKRSVIFLIAILFLLALSFVSMVILNEYYPAKNKKQKEVPIAVITTLNQETLQKGTIAEKPEFYSGTGGYVKIRVSYNKVSTTYDTKIDCFIFYDAGIELGYYLRTHPNYIKIGDSVVFRTINVNFDFPPPSAETTSTFGLIVKIKDINY